MHWDSTFATLERRTVSFVEELGRKTYCWSSGVLFFHFTILAKIHKTKGFFDILGLFRVFIHTFPEIIQNTYLLQRYLS